MGERTRKAHRARTLEPSAVISTHDLDATVASCDLLAFREFVGELIEDSLDARECEHIRAMQSFYHAPSRETLRRLLTTAWPLFTAARLVR